MSKCYVLHTTVLALRVDAEPELAQLPVGISLQILGEPGKSGLVQVREQDGATYTVFYSDLVERSQKASGAGS